MTFSGSTKGRECRLRMSDVQVLLVIIKASILVAQVLVESFSLMEKARPLLHVNKGIGGGTLIFLFSTKMDQT
jgi:hypothetical protein